MITDIICKDVDWILLARGIGNIENYFIVLLIVKNLDLSNAWWVFFIIIDASHNFNFHNVLFMKKTFFGQVTIDMETRNKYLS